MQTATYMHTYIQTYIQTYRQADRQTYRHTYRHTDIQTYRQTERQAGRQTDIQTYRQAERQADIQTGRQADIQTGTYIHTGRQTYIQTYIHTYTHTHTGLYIIYIHTHIQKETDTGRCIQRHTMALHTQTGDTHAQAGRGQAYRDREAHTSTQTDACMHGGIQTGIHGNRGKHTFMQAYRKQTHIHAYIHTVSETQSHTRTESHTHTMWSTQARTHTYKTVHVCMHAYTQGAVNTTYTHTYMRAGRGAHTAVHAYI